jgi:TMEM175 potassium channel family protein
MLLPVEGGDRSARETVDFSRIVAFTDGVFAIAITLLVLSLEVPSDLPGSELRDFLADSWGQLFAYFLSFAVIGRFWIAHHAYFAMLHSFDARLLVLNLAYLSLVVLVPFPTEILGEYGDRTDAVLLYALVLGTTSLLGWVMLRYTLRRGHVRPDALEQAARAAAGSVLPAIVFYASIPVSLLSPGVAQLVWLGMLADAFRGRR